MIHSQYSQPHLARSDQNQIQTCRGSDSVYWQFCTPPPTDIHSIIDLKSVFSDEAAWSHTALLTYRHVVPRAQNSKKMKVPAWYISHKQDMINKQQIIHYEKAMIICYLSSYTCFYKPVINCLHVNIFGKWPNVPQVMNSRRVDGTKLPILIHWCWCSH